MHDPPLHSDLRGKPSVLCFEHITEKLTMKSTRSKNGKALASGIINADEVVIDQLIGTLKYPGVAKGLYVASTSSFSLHNHMLAANIFVSKPALSRFLREMYKKLNGCPGAMIYRFRIENVDIAYALTFTCF
ncbi:Pseudouridine synthase, catalytic domain-containing protein [Artemisia annua]|uniref:Pseudouridine synthase, catalytic domain-containing protein n=1 Tax=Artemisia annua TaxID=35608 RepID=A0A2U1LNS5_ARTAN|nr:Pseudouridine synthase, catalytic domain-containing protein [Artemisia annua]